MVHCILGILHRHSDTPKGPYLVAGLTKLRSDARGAVKAPEAPKANPTLILLLRRTHRTHMPLRCRLADIP